MTYAEKLKDPRWQKKRLKIYERDDWTCQKCGSTIKTLSVHHLKYDGSEPWETKDEDLITLCENCHPKPEEASFWENDEKQWEKLDLDARRIGKSMRV